MTDNNRLRAFSDVVTVDAWHTGIDGAARADLHADVVFGEARVGGEANSPVRFKLRIRRAELVVVVPEVEPVSIDKASVSRDAPETHGRVVDAIKKHGKAKGVAAASASIPSGRANLQLDLQVEGAREHSSSIELAMEVRRFYVTQSQTREGHYRWRLEPVVGNFLDGRPWDANDEPRLSLLDLRKDRSKGIPAAVSVEVRCLREDLIIEEVKLKDESLWDVLRQRKGFQNREAAAAAYIRDQLLAVGLTVGDVSDPYSMMTLASVVATHLEDGAA